MTTLRDLSRHLGLSVTQVSRALNGHADVSAKTRARVVAAAQELDYHPNLSARKLVTGRSGMVGIVLSGKPVSPEDSYFLQMVAGLSEIFSHGGRQFVLHIADPKQNPVDSYRRLIDGGGLDGFVILSPGQDDPRALYLQKRGIPFVVHGRVSLPPAHPFFDIDNEDVGYRLARLLVERGHRRIAFLNGPERQTWADWRADGLACALAEAGVAPDPALQLRDHMTESFGMLGTLQLMTAPRPPTGIICGNTLILRGLLQTLASLGLRVPDDVSVVAHDDALPDGRAGGFDPAVTVTRAPLSDAWKPLADLLIARLEGEPVEDLQRWGRVEIIERGSVTAPRCRANGAAGCG